jgi:hypothetical protein
MFTVCPNTACSSRYKIRPEALGKRAKCSKCQQLFVVEEFKPPLDLEIAEEAEDQETGEAAPESGMPRKRRSSSEIIQEHLTRIKAEVSKILPALETALASDANESQTRLLINRFLEDVPGYDMADFKTEHSKDARRPDYVVNIAGVPAIVIEVKTAGMALRYRQLCRQPCMARHPGSHGRI